MSSSRADAAASPSPGTRYQQLLAPHLDRIEPVVLRRVSELLALTDFSDALTEPLSAEEVASLILLVGLGETGARWAGLLFPDDEGMLRPADRRGAASPDWDRLRFEVPDRLPEAAVLRLGSGDAARDAAASPFYGMMRESGAAAAALLRSREGLSGVLLLGGPHPDLAGSESDFLEALAVSAGAALEKCSREEELRTANRRLALRVYQLRSLMDLTAGLHRARDEGAVWDLLLNGAMGHVLASRAAVVAGDRVLAAKGPRGDFSRLLGAAEILNAQPKDEQRQIEPPQVLPAAELPYPEAARGLADLGIGWIVPFAAGPVRGLLFLGAAGFGRDLSSSDRAFLGSLAGQAAAAVESLRLTRASIEKEKELEVARRIQARFLPAEAPNPPGWDLSGINIPCLAVGGDYYDYLALGDSVFVTIADVSGKGAGPALIMASVQASLRAFFLHGHTRLDGAARELNQLLHNNTEDARYMTAVLTRLEPASGRVLYLNAGHVHPLLLRRNGAVERLDRGSTVLGLFPEIEIEVGSCDLETGDLLAMFTDGLSETEDPAGAAFEDGRIVAALTEARDRNARDICGELLSRARAFAGSNPVHDDLTLVVLKRTG